MADIAVDFDGTVVKHRYPDVGEDVPGAVDTLRDLVNNGHKLILNTMRSGETLQDAVDWFDVRRLPLYGINNNKRQSYWTASPKVWADVYIDDANACSPLIKENDNGNIRDYVNWVAIKSWLIQNNYL